jgi:vacuolar-type H+-ATPase subunit H
MTIWVFYLIVAFILVSGSAFIWLVLHLNRTSSGKGGIGAIDQAALNDVERIFTPDFREELKNRGRLHFEQIINDNAEFLQQDLRLTSAELSEFMKKELTSKVHEALGKYEQSVNDAKELAVESIKKTSLALDEQRQVLGEQVQKEIAIEKDHIISSFEKRVTEIVSHYIIEAIGNEVDLSDQLEYILDNFEANKKAMVEDIKNVG